jgi:hypothetical protein
MLNCMREERELADIVEAMEIAFGESLLTYDPLTVVQRHITSGTCLMLPDPQYTELKQQVSSHFSIHHGDILVVGSAKLGFSIAPRKRWKRFNDQSDVDVAIVSQKLYLSVWREVSSLVEADPLISWDREKSFLKYMLHGWIRPDLLPKSPALPRADEWFEYFRSLTASGVCGNYKINAGLYYDIHFLESYQSRAVAACINRQEEQEEQEEQ